jgi:hypothetical protein
MSSRQINLLLRTSAISLCAIAVLSIAASLLLPLQLGSSRNKQPRSTSPTTVPSAPVVLRPLESFAAVWANPLRRPLNDQTTDAQSPEAVAAQATAAAGLPPPVTLVGTVGTSLAMLRGPDGVVSVLRVGDQLAGAQVLAIRPAQIDVRFNGRTLTLDKAKEAGAGISIHGPSDDRVQVPGPSETINQQ